ncbi:galactose-binding domain-containing protein [Flavicella sediminum]|uniref:galactose-binding domain-containing protein n=1 Tax=Flavicella sediminum TaxID=2585141 RepID=UPI00112230A5|nr:T9SS type A sorting domain-containing protein [Flavicella sediminum]
MKIHYFLSRISVLVLVLLFSTKTQAQTTVVSSLEDLLPYLDDDNADVKLTPGTYNISAIDITQGRFSNPLFLFEGSNSTYDFTDVTINISTTVFQKFGSVEVKEIQILGNNNVLKNLKLVDTGNTRPSKTAQNITMDGRDNRIEGFHLATRGSYPYGYGDAFGKGGGSVIKHYKHSAVLIRGLRNHLKNTTVISRSYGHIVFMQAASYPLIEGCYLEGEMRTTDDMLTEVGTGTPADNVDFMTVWGYKLPAGYMMSMQEGGIRAYNAGTTYIDGVEIQRGTDNPKVLNCTIKNARTGVTLAHATGTKYVEGCTTIGCENGYSIGSGTVVNCGADATYGPVYKNAYSSDNGYTADITILPPSAAYYNGHDAIAYVGGKNHNLTFRSEETNIPSNLKIMVSGDMQNLRLLNGSNASQNNLTSSNITLKNLTKFPIVLHGDSSNISVSTCDTDEVTDNGSTNTVTSLNCDSVNLALLGEASQSSSRPNDGFAANAIDDNTSGAWANNSVTHTNTETNPWWKVELQAESSIGDINIFNRTDNCCKARLGNFTVYVLDANGNTSFSKTISNAPDPSVSIDANGALGKTVKIILNGTNPLSLAEVQVFEKSLSVANYEKELNFYPNPVTSELHISLAQLGVHLAKTNIVLLNVNGQIVKRVAVGNSEKISLQLAAIKSGVYILQISDGSKTIRRKIIKS